MKSIILIALFCATALAVPAKPADRKTKAIDFVKEKVVPHLASFPFHKLTRANVHHLLEEGKPGLREIVDQFFVSMEDIYNLLERDAGRFVQLFKKYNLNKIIQAELPAIAERVGAQEYEFVHEIVGWVADYYHSSDEAIVEMFIELGLVASAFYVPMYASDELRILISGVNTEAGKEFEQILEDLVYDSFIKLADFSNVVWEALEALEDKH